MASGDTKTQQYLDIAANGTRADLPSDTCCETRTQTLIRGVAERIMDVEDEVERLENNPDVVDIVDTYADLQAYSTSGLTDKDIIRVIADETKGGLSSYYRWNSPNPGWNFVGVIPGGDGIKELSSADYNYPTANPDRVALWLLDNGLYTAPAGVMVAASTTSYPWYNTSDKTILVGGSDTVKGIYTFLNGKTDVVTTQVSDGTEADEYTLLKSTQVLQATGQSTTDTMSQKAITDAIAASSSSYTAGDGIDISAQDVISATNTGKAKILTAADYNWPTDNPTSVALWLLDPGIYYYTDGTITVRPSTDQSAQPEGIFIVGDGDSGGIRPIFWIRPNETWNYRVYSDGSRQSRARIVFGDIANDLTTNASGYVLDARQGKALKDIIDSIAIRGAGAPTTSTVGEVGQLYEDGTNGTLYQLKSIDITTTPNTYNWEQVGGSSVNVVQTTGTSTTDVMSQNAVTSMVFADNSTNTIEIGMNARNDNNATSVAIGWTSRISSNAYNSIAIGKDSTATAQYSIALGGATANVQGVMAIGTSASSATQGYNGSAYRLLTGLYDPQNAHDAANKEYVDGLISALEARIAALEGN